MMSCVRATAIEHMDSISGYPFPPIYRGSFHLLGKEREKEKLALKDLPYSVKP